MKITNEKQISGAKLNGWLVESHTNFYGREWQIEAAYTDITEALVAKKELNTNPKINSLGVPFSYRIRKVGFLSPKERQKLEIVIIDQRNN